MVSLLNRSRVYEDSFENAYDVGYSKRSDEVWEMNFSLPLNDRKADLLKDSAFKYIELEDKDEEYIGLYRILPYSITIDEEAQTISCTAYQVINTLMDSVILGAYKKENTLVSTIIGDLLAMQKTAHWTLGLCEATDKIDVDWYNESGLIEPLYEILAKLDGKYVYTFQTKVYPWVLDLVKVASEPVCRIKDGHNLQNLTIDYDPSQMINRVYPIGQDEDGEPVYIPGNYVQNETSVAKYGPIEAIYENSEIEDVVKLEEEAVKVLEASQDMVVEWSVKASDLIKLADARGIQPIDGGENLILDSARGIDFSTKGDVATNVQDFEGRNYGSLQEILKLSSDKSIYQDSHGAYIRFDGNDTINKNATPLIVDKTIYTVRHRSLKETGNNPRFRFIYTDGTNKSLGSYNNTESPEDYIATATKPVDHLDTTYGSRGWNRLYELQINKGEKLLPYSPAPEDLTHAETYQLSKPIEQGKTYTLSIDEKEDDWYGVWLGEDYFAGYEGSFVDPRGENLCSYGDFIQPQGTSRTEIIRNLSEGVYTLSFEWDIDESKYDIPTHFRWYSPTMSGVNLNLDFENKTGTHTFEVLPEYTRDPFWVYGGTSSNNSLTREVIFKNVKIEKGSTATPYISAEDDRKTLILKSLKGTKISHVKLEEGEGATPWKRASSEVLPYPAIPTIDRLRLNQMVRIDVEGLGDVDMIIKGESKSDIYGAPEDIDLELDNGKKNEPYSMVGVHRSLSDIRQKIDNNVFSVIARGREIATDLINSGHGGYVRYYPNRILIMDTEEEGTATNVWQFNVNGIGHSSTGVNGPWKYAWTIDGRFNTDFIETGAITTNMISSDYGANLLADTNSAIGAINDQISNVLIQLGANNLLLTVQSAAGGDIATQNYVQNAVEAINRANPNKISTISESWEQGRLNASTGAETTSSTIIRSKAYYPIRAGAVTMSMNDKYEGIIYFYDDNYQYKSSSSTFSSLVTVTIPSDYRFRVAVRFKSGASIVPSAIDHVDLKVENAAEATAWTPYFGDLSENLQNDYFLLVLSSDNGWVVDKDNWTTTLRAHLFWYNDEVTTEHDAFNFVWYRQYPGQNRTAVGAGYTLQVSGSDLSKSATYTCEFLSTSIINLLTTRAGDTLMTRNNDNIMIIGDY